MITLSTFETKTRLSELLAAVEQGEQVVITRHGQPVAKLVSIHDEAHLTAADRKARKLAMKRVMEARKSLGRALVDFDVKAAAEEGRD